ncbi:MAG: bile acid:sodium symporter family protein [Thomasclavelia sp.]|nr:bile acid:sodium symporter family protein [Thomasclavelia sp.]
MNTLKKISKFLSNYTAPVVIIIAVITFFIPDLFKWVQGQTQTIILGIIMLSMGMTLSTEDFKILASRPLDILIGTCAQFTVMPFIAFTLTKVLNLDPGIAVGLILVGCCPGGVSSNIMCFLCNGDVPFSVGMTTVSTLLAPIMTPLLVSFLANKTIAVDAGSMFLSILQVTIIPIAIGFTLNYFLHKKEVFQDVKELMPAVSVLGLACIVGGVIAYQGNSFFTSGVTIFIAVFLHNGIGYLLGYGAGTLFKFNTAKRRTISIEVGMQNAGLATNLASVHFATLPEAALASAVSCVWHSISGTLMAGLFSYLDKRKGIENKNK